MARLMDEEATFNKLRQLPIDDMNAKLNGLQKPSPTYNWNGQQIFRADHYHEIAFHYERVKLLKDNGWEFEDFILANEKHSILTMIAEYNLQNPFPNELVERAKRFFPNAAFTQASITLE